MMFQCPKCSEITPGNFAFRPGAAFAYLCPECDTPLSDDDLLPEETGALLKRNQVLEFENERLRQTIARLIAQMGG